MLLQACLHPLQDAQRSVGIKIPPMLQTEHRGFYAAETAKSKIKSGTAHRQFRSLQRPEPFKSKGVSRMVRTVGRRAGDWSAPIWRPLFSFPDKARGWLANIHPNALLREAGWIC